jgi:hypothetical protein
MVLRTAEALPELFESDETHWLETMSQLIRNGRYDKLDYAHLGEYLTDMARRDKREVMSRLAVLIAHMLKWTWQPDKQPGGWRVTIELQRQELAELLASQVLRQHAVDELPKAYANGVKQAAAQTGLPASTFPAKCPYSLDRLLADQFESE